MITVLVLTGVTSEDDLRRAAGRRSRPRFRITC